MKRFFKWVCIIFVGLMVLSVWAAMNVKTPEQREAENQAYREYLQRKSEREEREEAAKKKEDAEYHERFVKWDAEMKAKWAKEEEDAIARGEITTTTTGTGSSKSTWVNGYTKKNGTVVRGHYRR